MCLSMGNFILIPESFLNSQLIVPNVFNVNVMLEISSEFSELPHSVGIIRKRVCTPLGVKAFQVIRSWFQVKKMFCLFEDKC